MLGDLSPLTPGLQKIWWQRYRVKVFSYRTEVLLVRYARLSLHPVCCYELYVGSVDAGRLPSYLIGWMQAMQRRKRDREELEQFGGFLSDPGFSQPHPQLWEHLTSERFEDGTPRKTSSLLVFSQDGRIKLMLKDKEEGEVCFLTATGITQGLAALEEGLSQGKLDWRRDKEAPAREGRGPKRRA